MTIKPILNSIEATTAEIKGQLAEGGNIQNAVRLLDERVDLLREAVEGEQENSMDNVNSISDWETWEREQSEERRKSIQPWSDHDDVPTGFCWRVIAAIAVVVAFWGCAGYIAFHH